MTAACHTHVRRFGAGRLPALALHCTLAHSGAWRALGAALAGDLTLHAIDLPGHGQSDDWDPAGDLHDQCTEAALAHLDAPMHLIGHSFGATVALRVAVEHTALVRSLTLIEPVFFAAAMADAPDKMRAHEREAKPYFDALARGDHPRAARLFNRFWGDGTRWDDMPAGTREYLARRVHLVPAQASAIVEDRAGLLAPGALARIEVPSLLIQGDQTAEIIDVISASLAARLPHARRAWIAGAGHMSPLTHPAQVAAEIRSLVEMAEK
ncbi:alpha/beta fold hydrolase [Roseobacter sinensis]|uniref:Alpha/beta hydrolase n=1 Tax=Roseobacter sinensis TaxID=2931391 RepID=A0ABT3BAK6_9RHOB|nr:alpha/beta hydrolase [Roseobacter sp. WL0113]MCV3270611.1 alpha/beta hydrolase [Roseobacter sp. WL0113]